MKLNRNLLIETRKLILQAAMGKESWLNTIYILSGILASLSNTKIVKFGIRNQNTLFIIRKECFYLIETQRSIVNEIFLPKLRNNRVFFYFFVLLKFLRIGSLTVYRIFDINAWFFLFIYEKMPKWRATATSRKQIQISVTNKIVFSICVGATKSQSQMS